MLCEQSLVYCLKLVLVFLFAWLSTGDSCYILAFYESQDSNDLDSSNETESVVTYDPRVDIEDDEDDVEQKKPPLRFHARLF